MTAPSSGRESATSGRNSCPISILSFTVLGLRWIAGLEIRSRAEYYDRAYVNLWLFYLLLITCVPFSTIVVGRHASLAPAVWLYAGHLLLIALVSMRMMALTPHLEAGGGPSRWARCCWWSLRC